MTTFTFSDQTLADALRWVIATMNPPVVPVTTLNGPVSAGAQTVTIHPLLTRDGASRFLSRGWVVIDDNTGEQTLDIIDVSTDGTEITVDFSGLTAQDGTPLTGLEFGHADGARIYTNLDTDAYLEISNPLALGDPVIDVLVTHEEDDPKTFGGNQGAVEAVYTAHIEYFRRLALPAGVSMGPNRWAKAQQQAARRDMNAIKAAIRGNRSLISDYLPAQALQLGVPGRKMFVGDWGRLTRDVDVHTFAATLDVVVLGNYLT